jgi:hypothetical protein
MDLALGYEYIMYLDKDGKIIKFSSETAVKRYGVVIATYIEQDFGDVYQIQLMTDAGLIETYNLYKKINGQFHDYNATNAEFAETYPNGGLVAFETNSFNEIKKIYTADDSNLYNSKGGISSALRGVEINAAAGKLAPYSVTNNSRIFVSDTVKEYTGSSNVRLVDKFVSDDIPYTGYAVYDKDTREIKAVIFYEAVSGVKWNSYPFVITQKRTILIDGEYRVRYQGLVNGEITEFTVAKNKYELSGFKVNDIILYSVNWEGELSDAFMLAELYYNYYEVKTNAADFTIREDNADRQVTDWSYARLYAQKSILDIRYEDWAVLPSSNAYQPTRMKGYAYAGKAYIVSGNSISIITDYAATFDVWGRRYGDTYTKDYPVLADVYAYKYNGLTNKITVTSLAGLETDRNTGDDNWRSYNSPQLDNDDSVYVYNYGGDAKLILIIDAMGK